MTSRGIYPDASVNQKNTFARVCLNEFTGQKSLYATRNFSRGEVISPFHAGTTQPYLDRFTVQIEEGTHITLLPEMLQYINHSCAPNAFFDTTLMLLTCLRDIQEGDEITFFYPGTEWEMAEPFDCNCGNPSCLKIINGASSLPFNILKEYKLTDFISRMVKRKFSL